MRAKIKKIKVLCANIHNISKRMKERGKIQSERDRQS